MWIDTVLFSIQIIMTMESPHENMKQCVCVYRWFRQHEFIEKLNMQAILNASANQEEFIKDLFVSLGKVGLVIFVG